MSDRDAKKAPDYLREARIRAGCASRSTAAMRVPYSQETIGRHERGDVMMEPADALAYAKGYKAPGLLMHFCADCPVGRYTGRKVTDRPLPYATLRVCRMLVDGEAVTDRLLELAFDGVIDGTEREDFCRALSYLERLEETIQDMVLLGYQLGIKSGAGPGGSGTGTDRKDKVRIPQRAGRVKPGTKLGG